MSLRINKSGFLSLIQDYGRYGFQDIGVTHGGPLDENAFMWANRLLDNDFNAAQIEVSYGAFSATFIEATTIAVCGADLSATINEQAIKPWQSYRVNAGDTIQFKSPVSGLRSYIAVKGGFTLSPQLNSCATVMREKLGGLNQDGDKLNDGDTIAFTSYSHGLSKRVPAHFIRDYPKHITLRFIPNTSHTSAGEKALQTFLKQAYKVSPNIDRMGYRLSGEVIKTESTGIISQGIALGSIQVPKDGQPIVLMRDRQTMGGYPLLGCISYLDLCKLAQSLPGTEVSFTPVDVEEVEAELIIHKNFFGINV